jgi:16S rRNA processing protein RimM
MQDPPETAGSRAGATSTDDARILLGRIVGAHGIKGDVIVHSFAAEPEDIAGYGALSDKAGVRSFKLRVLRMTPKGAIIARIAGVADRNAAEALKGVELYVARDKLPKPDEDQFYHADLIGLAAVGPDGQPIGEVVAVQNYGAGDLLEIRIPGAGDTALVLFTDSFVPRVDLAARQVVVVMPVEAGDLDDEGQGQRQ